MNGYALRMNGRDYFPDGTAVDVQAVTCSACGAECKADGITAGYALTGDGQPLCNHCMGELELAAMKQIGRGFLYPSSSEGSKLVTWAGNYALRITGWGSRYRSPFGDERVNVQCVGSEAVGRGRWYGTIYGGCYARVRRCKVSGGVTQ